MQIARLHYLIILIIGVLVFQSSYAAAPICNNVFATSLNTVSSNSTISFTCNSYTQGSLAGGDNATVVGSSIAPAAAAAGCTPTCNSANCTPVGNAPSMSLGTFQTTTSTTNLTIAANGSGTAGTGGTVNYGTITIGSGGTLTFASQGSNTVYIINSLQATTGTTTISLVPGTYWINTNNLNYVYFLINGNGTAKVYFNSSVNNGSVQFNVVGNNNSTTGPPNNLFVYVNGNVTMDAGSILSGYLYATGTVTYGATTGPFGGNTKIYGAITSVGNIKLGPNSGVNGNSQASYNSTSFPLTDFGGLCTPPPPLTNLLITYGSNSSANCITVPVTVTAQNNGSTATTYNQQISLTTSTGKGNWSLITGNGTFTAGASNTGTATYTYDTSDQGVAVFGLTYVNGAASVTANASLSAYPSITDTGTQGSITFTESTLYLTSSPITGTPTSITGFSNNDTAGTNDTMYVTAYGYKSAGVCGIVTTYTGNKSLKFWSTYVNPTTGTKTYAVNGNNIATTSGAATAQTITFTNGAASVPILYRDVGSMKISVQDTAFPCISCSGTYAVTNSTANFIVKPSKFVTTVTGNPGATSATGTKFIAAGQPFTTTVVAQDTAGNVTPNYGLETPAQSVQISSNLVLPAGGNAGAITNGSAFTRTGAGTLQNTTASFSEVGIITLTTGVSGNSYLGGANTTSTSGNVGRFTPAKFAVTGNTPSFSAACTSGSFTYLNQKFNYSTVPILTVTAQNNSGVTTQNYTGAFLKLTTSSVVPSYTTNSVGTTLNTAASSFSIVDNANGTAAINFSAGTGFYFPKVNSTSIIPFTAQIALSTNVIDSDGIVYPSNPFALGTTSNGISFSPSKQFYEGRMIIDNAFGSELLPLSGNIKFQYYTAANTWATNILDSCSTFNSTSNLIITSTNSNLLTATTASLGTRSNGVIPLTFSAPGSGITGNLTVEGNISATGANMPHLQYYWPYDTSGGVANGNPKATFSFGLYPGKSFITYIRDIYN